MSNRSGLVAKGTCEFDPPTSCRTAAFVALVAAACAGCSLTYTDVDGTIHIVGLNSVSLRQDCSQATGQVIEISNRSAGAAIGERIGVYSLSVGWTEERYVTATKCNLQLPQTGAAK